MVDNPKIFITYIVAIILVVAAVFTGIRLLGNKEGGSKENSNATSTASTGGTKNTSKGTPVKTTPVAYDALVIYDANGFSPNKTILKAGSVVRFSNRSGETMRIWPAEETLPNATYAGLKQENSVGKNGTFDVHFSQKGIFLYENLNHKSRTGLVEVQ